MESTFELPLFLSLSLSERLSIFFSRQRPIASVQPTASRFCAAWSSRFCAAWSKRRLVGVSCPLAPLAAVRTLFEFLHGFTNVRISNVQTRERSFEDCRCIKDVEWKGAMRTALRPRCDVPLDYDCAQAMSS